VKNRRGISRALVLARILTVTVAAIAAAIPAAASAASSQSVGAAPGVHQAGAEAPSASHPAPALDGMLTGVVRGAGGAALPGACVTAAGPADATSGITRAGGRYDLSGLLPGAYTVGYSDCADPAKYFDQWYGGADVAAGAARVLLAAGRPTALRPVTLRPTSPVAAAAATRRALGTRRRSADRAAASGALIAGTVRDAAGKPLARICVQASTSAGDFGEEDFGFTGRRGGYRMAVDTAGKWQVQFSGGCGNSHNYAPQWWRLASTRKKATDLHVRPGSKFRHIDAVLRPGAALAGTVRAASGSRQNLAGVCVDAVGLGAVSQVEMQAATRADGSYVVRGLGTGRYRVHFQPDCGQRGNFLNSTLGRTVAVTDGKTTRGVNGALRTGGEISGVATSRADGSPLAGICMSGEDGLREFEAITSKTGTYTVRRVPPGSYRVSFLGGCGNSGSFAPQYYDGASNFEGYTPVTVSVGEIRSGIDAAMLGGGTVTGLATSKAGAKLAGVCVAVTSRADAGGFGTSPLLEELLDEPFISQEGVTGHTGRFAVRNLMPGLYSVEFTGGCGHGSARYASQVFAPQAGHGPGWISVNGGVVTAGVSAVLQPGAAISGVITGNAGRRLTAICALAFHPGGGPVVDAAFLNSVGSVRGRYRINGLAAGRYAVNFSPCNEQPYASQWYRGKSTEASAGLVPVRAGQTTERINARLNGGGRISGRLLSGISGKPVANGCVELATSAGTPTAFSMTGKSGNYRIPHVPAGRWVLAPGLCALASPSLAGIVRRGVVVRDRAAATKVTMTLPRAGRIAGTVLGGAPAAAEPGICVEATPRSGIGQPGLSITGATGHYTLFGLARGSYLVQFSPNCLFGTAAVVPQWFRGQPTRATATTVRVVAGQTTTSIGASLVSDGEISGTVTGPSAAAITGVCVGAYAGTGTTPAAVAITGKDGSYQLGELTPRKYVVEFSAGCGDHSYTTQWFSGATSRAGATPVTVTAGADTTAINAG
jgi:hypothetical protein